LDEKCARCKDAKGKSKGGKTETQEEGNAGRRERKGAKAQGRKGEEKKGRRKQEEKWEGDVRRGRKTDQRC
jgi:hypothetical protein